MLIASVPYIPEVRRTLIGRQEKGYVIRFNPETVEFPRFCPVCESPATSAGFIVASGSEIGDAKKHHYAAWDQVTPFAFLYRKGPGRPLDGYYSVRDLRIPTCEDHAYPAYEMNQKKWVYLVVNAFSTLLFIFFIISVLIESVYRSQIWIPPSLVLPLPLVTILMLTSYRLLGSNDLMKAFTILDSGEEDMMVVQIRNQAYAQEFLHHNPESAVIFDPSQSL